ncbi:unnamed protein product [Didymodactylos carnosus]|uniref:EF-hand domain-containing protein n=1 Tax=Didymodactylos carnosus TaxID=1234261 RepID=A0A8S2NKA1_9BILA|nr:unnamed protein product [Didymodactylos carnosus]CAF4006054.1 unnamed protein product [Didymodactylos carnosus]
MLFLKWDNGNHILSLAEIDRAITYWNPEYGTDKRAIMRAFRAADSNGNGFVDLSEFGLLLDLLVYYNDLSQKFKVLDINGDKRISFDEFKKGYAQEGRSISDRAELKREFDAIDTNHGGYILFDEV